MRLQELKDTYDALSAQRGVLLEEAESCLSAKRYIEFVTFVNKRRVIDDTLLLEANEKVDQIVQSWLEFAPIKYQTKNYSPKK